MQHTLLGPERFRRGMDLYFERHDGQAVTCDDFVQAMQDASRRRTSTQFRRWYSQAGTPVVTRARHATTRRRARYTLDVAQRTPATPGQPREAAVAHSARGRAGRTATAATCRCASTAKRAPGGTTRVLRRRAKRADVPLRRRRRARRCRRCCADSPRRCALEFDYTDDGARVPRRARQRRRQPLGRRAAQLRARDARARARAHARGDAAGAAGVARRASSRQLLADRASDPALIALALTPPDAGLRRGAASRRSTSTARRRARVRRARARARASRRVRARVRAQRARGALCADAGADRRRACSRNACLRYLGAIDDAPARALAVAQFDAADNMTDADRRARRAERQRRAGARRAVRALRGEVARRAAGARQVVRAAGARRSAPDTLARVRALLAHPRFNARNPNRVRSLVGAFALRNLLAFHAADGVGLRVRRRPGPGARPPQSAARGDARRRVQPVEALRRAAPRRCSEPRCSASPPRRSCRRTSRKSSSGISRTRRFAPYGYANVRYLAPR